VAVAIAALEYLWSSTATAPFTWLWRISGILLVGAVLWTALLAVEAGSPLSAIGFALLVVGWLTLLFGIGAVAVLAGFVLYIAGLMRTRVVERRSLYLALALLAAALAAAIVVRSQVPAFELAAAAAVVTGVGMSPDARARITAS
jgi:hypothetical protein